MTCVAFDVLFPNGIRVNFECGLVDVAGVCRSLFEGVGGCASNQRGFEVGDVLCNRTWGSCVKVDGVKCGLSDGAVCHGVGKLQGVCDVFSSSVDHEKLSGSGERFLDGKWPALVEGEVSKGDLVDDVEDDSCEVHDVLSVDQGRKGEAGVVQSPVVKERSGFHDDLSVPGAFGNSCNEESSGCEGGHGPNWERNKRKRVEKKEKKKRRQEIQKNKWSEVGKRRGVVSSIDEEQLQGSYEDKWRKAGAPFSLEKLSRDQDIELRNTSAAKWKAQNELAAEKARRELEVLKASDVTDEIKRYRTKVSATIERNMVSIEKTHATLRATGNVAGEFHGSAETVMTPGLSSGTISPDSSASMQEFRAVQKENLDLRNKIKIATDKLGIDIEHIDLYDKDIWTNNSDNEAILDEMYPNGYGMDGTFCDEGKVRVIPT